MAFTMDKKVKMLGLYSALPIMPLKSDGSLYGIQPLSRSQAQTMATTSTPKLESLLGGETLVTPHNGCNVREATPLSLNSMFYNYNKSSCCELNNQKHLNHVKENINQQQFSYYLALRNHDMMLEGSKQNQGSYGNLQLTNRIIVPVEDNGGKSGHIGPMTYGDLKSLSLSMSPSSQASCVDSIAMDTRKRRPEIVDQNQKQIVHRKSIGSFGQRTSQYRGVTRHRWTGRYEAHLWDNSYKKEGQSRKGRQVYLGGYDLEEKAARAYDLAALKYWGPSASRINFLLENYQSELEEMKNMTRQEYVAHIRRKSSGFSRGASMYRGVTRHHQHGRWQARIGRVAGNKDLYLGTFCTQEEAAEAYDIAVIKFRGVNAVTNFDITRYDVEKIMASSNLVSSEQARRNKEMGDDGTGNESVNLKPSTYDDTEDAILMQKSCKSQQQEWKMALYQIQSQSFSMPLNNIIFHEEVEESSKMETHMSNPSSLVTTLSSSREDYSPDRTRLSVLFEMPSTASNLLSTIPTSNVDSWKPLAHLRPALSLPQMPDFAAWWDA